MSVSRESTGIRELLDHCKTTALVVNSQLQQYQFELHRQRVELGQGVQQYVSNYQEKLSQMERLVEQMHHQQEELKRERDQLSDKVASMEEEMIELRCRHWQLQFEKERDAEAFVEDICHIQTDIDIIGHQQSPITKKAQEIAEEIVNFDDEEESELEVIREVNEDEQFIELSNQQHPNHETRIEQPK